VLIVARQCEALNETAIRDELQNWATVIRDRVYEQDSRYLVPTAALAMLKHWMPELATPVDKFEDFLLTASLPLVWSAIEPPAGQLHSVGRWRKFYRNGAYRLYAPSIDYDRVIDQASAFRRQQRNPSILLTRWNQEYSLGGDLQPIINVLREIGLIR
jgi:hypothetical protein